MSTPVPTPTPTTGTPVPVPFPTTPAPATVQSVSVDANVLKQILQSVADSVTQRKTYPKPQAPRVGGVNEVGAWTGNGAADDLSTPRTNSCMRKLIMDESKNYAQVSIIEEKCRLGLKSVGGPYFCLETEPDAKHVVTTILNLQAFLETHGMEPVFDIIKSDGTKISMLAQPAMLTASMLTDWLQALRQDGVPDGKGGKLPLCPYDKTNLEWSYDAIMNSCSPALQRELKNQLTPQDQYGPMVLYQVLSLVYRHTESKVEKILKELDALSIRDFPGQNVTQYKQRADTLLNELEMNVIRGQVIPTLRTKTLKGLTLSTFSFFQNKIIDMTMETSIGSNSSTIDAVKSTLRDIQQMYLTLLEQGNYPPGKQAGTPEDSKLKGLQAQVSKLTSDITKLSQDRSANTDGSSHRKGKNNPNVTCYGCGEKGHVVSDPKCPKYDEYLKKKGAGAGGILKPSKYEDKAVKFEKNPPGTNGLDADTNSKVSKLIKEKMKEDGFDPKQVGKDDVIELKLDGQVVAIFCKQCRRFTRGDKKHSTADHKGRKKGLMLKLNLTKSNTDPTTSVSPPPQPDPEPTCVSIPPPVTYDFGSMTRSTPFSPSSTTIDETPLFDDDASYDSMDNRLLAVLSRTYPKGAGRQD